MELLSLNDKFAYDEFLHRSAMRLLDIIVPRTQPIRKLALIEGRLRKWRGCYIGDLLPKLQRWMCDKWSKSLMTQPEYKRKHDELMEAALNWELWWVDLNRRVDNMVESYESLH